MLTVGAVHVRAELSSDFRSQDGGFAFVKFLIFLDAAFVNVHQLCLPRLLSWSVTPSIINTAVNADYVCMLMWISYIMCG